MQSGDSAVADASHPVSPETLALVRTGRGLSGGLLVCATWETDSRPEVLELASRLTSETRAEPGCISFELCLPVEHSRRVVVLERYTDVVAFDAHRHTPHFLEIMQGQIAPLLSSRQIVVHEV
ncbi:putative quinol monooxygenase [Agrococcus sediminis]|uniref:putative quinol monooxygenase n=1 Tax=Agrococcus sediminis TaxID=2599924 RepID=UPI00381F6906